MLSLRSPPAPDHHTTENETVANRITVTRKQTGATWEHVITDCEMVAVRLYGKSDEAAQAVADALFPKRVAMSTKTETAAEVLAEMRRDTLSEAYTYTAEIEKYIDRLERAHANDLASLLPGPDYMDPPDGGDVTLLEQCRRMSEDAAKWRALSAQGEAVAAYRLRTGAPRTRWQWMDGKPSAGVIQEAELHGWEIEYAYTHPAPARVTEEARALHMDAVKEALTRWPDSSPAIHFMSAAIGPLEPITADDIAWANAALEADRHD